MYHGNGRPLTKKQLVRLTVGLTILAWATQTLFAQWGFGAVSSNRPVGTDRPAAPSAVPPQTPAERFIAPSPAQPAGGTLELRTEATIVGPEVRLKQIARWSNRDATFFEQAGELVLARLDARGPYRVIDLAQVRQTLSDAGINLGLVKFAGPMSCSVNRSDTSPDSQRALARWIDAKEQKELVTDPAPAIARPSAAKPASTETSADAASSPVKSLRELVMQDLSSRLHIPVDQLQVSFNPKDERLLNLCEPQFRFQLDPQRVRNLGEVIWSVTITAGDKSQKTLLSASARAWQTQAVVARPLAARAPISAEDIRQERTLTDRLADEPLLNAEQAIGQLAARDLKPGMVLTGRMIESLPMARNGQLVTVLAGHGAIRVKTVVRAMETGARGQRIRVKNEATNEQFDVVLTGPQEASMGS